MKNHPHVYGGFPLNRKIYFWILTCIGRKRPARPRPQLSIIYWEERGVQVYINILSSFITFHLHFCSRSNVYSDFTSCVNYLPKLVRGVFRGTKFELRVWLPDGFKGRTSFSLIWVIPVFLSHNSFKTRCIRVKKGSRGISLFTEDPPHYPLFFSRQCSKGYGRGRISDFKGDEIPSPSLLLIPYSHGGG